jgi:hypothetical protein
MAGSPLPVQCTFPLFRSPADWSGLQRRRSVTAGSDTGLGAASMPALQTLYAGEHHWNQP